MIAAVVICAGISCFVVSKADEARSKSDLWAGINVTEPVVCTPLPKYWMFQFAVINDGDKTIDPKIESSQLLINGKEPKDWNFIINNGLRSSNFYALPPGKTVRFVYALKRYFEEPGIYNVQWKGEEFESPKIIFRVMSKDSCQ